MGFLDTFTLTSSSIHSEVSVPVVYEISVSLCLLSADFEKNVVDLGLSTNLLMEA